MKIFAYSIMFSFILIVSGACTPYYQQDTIPDNSIHEAITYRSEHDYTQLSSPFGFMLNPITNNDYFHLNEVGITNHYLYHGDVLIVGKLPVSAGMQIRAAEDGFIRFAYDDTVIIYHGSGYTTTYIADMTIRAVNGRFIERGTPIAILNTDAYEYLHFESSFTSRIEEPSPIEPFDINIESDNRSFTMTIHHNTAVPEEPIIFAEDVAIMAADFIYDSFNICIDGMYGHMLLNRGSRANIVDLRDPGRWVYFWAMSIFSEELTTHTDDNQLFFLSIDAATGEVTSMHMSTVETGFVG